jgi:hypothetical protein
MKYLKLIDVMNEGFLRMTGIEKNTFHEGVIKGL